MIAALWVMCTCLIAELFVDDAFKWFVVLQSFEVADEPIDIAPSAILTGPCRVRGHHDIGHIPERTVGR